MPLDSIAALRGKGRCRRLAVMTVRPLPFDLFRLDEQQRQGAYIQEFRQSHHKGGR